MRAPGMRPRTIPVEPTTERRWARNRCIQSHLVSDPAQMIVGSTARQIGESIEPLAERHPGWVPFRHLAEGHYQRLRGALQPACEAYERCLALATPDPNHPYRSIMAWPLAAPAYVDTLLALNRVQEAHAFAVRSLAECVARELGSAGHEFIRMLAVAEAKLGDHAGAAARLDALIERERGMGISGLTLGMAYEARTRVAIWAGDKAGVERFAHLRRTYD